MGLDSRALRGWSRNSDAEVLSMRMDRSFEGGRAQLAETWMIIFSALPRFSVSRAQPLTRGLQSLVSYDKCTHLLGRYLEDRVRVARMGLRSDPRCSPGERLSSDKTAFIGQPPRIVRAALIPILAAANPP